MSWVDGHSHPSIRARKPDIVHYAKNHSESVDTIAIVGDLKSQTKSHRSRPSDDAIACLVDFISELAVVQVWRRKFIGYLLDGKHISFFVMEFDSPKRGELRAMVCALPDTLSRPLLFSLVEAHLPEFVCRWK